MRNFSKAGPEMRVGFFNYYEVYNNNRMFTDKDAPIGDDLLYPNVYLRQYFVEKGHRVDTIDTDDLKNFDAFVFMDFPTFGNKYFMELIKSGCKNLYLMIWESEIIRPDNWNKENHKYFRKIFTWNDDYVDNFKYFKLNFSQRIPEKVDTCIARKSKFCTMIACNKSQNHPLELYTERKRAICWFEENHPGDFDLYGFGWDKHYFTGYMSKLNRIKFLTKLLRPRYSVYRGSIRSKREIMNKYRFSICYENGRSIPGYITEKIFDCFFAGCVPVYLGSPNVTDYIPPETFIDRRSFKTYEELYKYMKNMPDKEYEEYLEAIKDFVQSERIYPFSAECYAETLFREIVERQGDGR